MTREQEIAKLIREQSADQAEGTGLTDVDPKDRNSLDLPEYQLGIESASALFAGLPAIEIKKNVAAAEAGGPILSGFGGDELGITNVVYGEGVDSGHETTPSVFDPKNDEGRYESSHSERKAAASRGGQSFASSKPMCPACQGWFGSFAMARRRPYFVADPTGVHVLKPNGSHVMAGHPSGADTLDRPLGRPSRRR